VPAASLSEKVLLIETAMARGRVAHAFGGAIALAYYATPRATIDIDLNVFVDTARAGDVLSLLERLGAQAPTPGEQERLARDGQARIHWDGTPIDLFFAYDAFHTACLERRRVVPFGEGDAIHVLSAEDLTVFKCIFDRPKDWRDLAELVYAQSGELDDVYIVSWLERIVGRDDARFTRFEETLAENG